MQPEIHNKPIAISYCDLPNSGEAVIDCRSIDEFEVAHIDNAIHIPLQHLSIRKDTFPCSKGQTFFVYCKTGNRSHTFVTYLRSVGYTNCQSIAEGFEEWGDK
jgi:rhodanese-related sulfurtransferase|tara:strand:+ start:359 stop:667 length:309 start_codon:yes stop_codon:yes gene_type:complete